MTLITTLAQNREPSLRTRQPSASNLPSLVAVANALAGTPGGAIFVRIEALKMPTDNLDGPITFDTLGPCVPVADDAGGIKREQSIVDHRFDKMLKPVFCSFPLGRFPDQPLVSGGKLGGALDYPAFQALLAFAESGFRLLASPDLFLSGVIESHFVHGDAGLNRNRRHDALRAYVKDITLWVPEE